MQQQVVAEAVRVQQIEREQQIKVQEAEILRREKELIATVLKPAEVERQRIAVLADAEKSRLTTEAEGLAAATRMQGEAEADIIFKKGDAEARAMNVKAEAFQEYNQAAVIDKLLTGAARDRRARSPRRSRRSTRSPSSRPATATPTGMHKLTGDITEIAAQVPALFEALSGMPMSDLLSKVREDRRQGAEAGQIAVRPGHTGARTWSTMAVLERVATLVRANLNDLIDRAEDPRR